MTTWAPSSFGNPSQYLGQQFQVPGSSQSVTVQQRQQPGGTMHAGGTPNSNERTGTYGQQSGAFSGPAAGYGGTWAYSQAQPQKQAPFAAYRPPPGDTMYAGGTPYFNERTGTYSPGSAQSIPPQSQGTPYRPQVSVYQADPRGGMQYTPTSKTMNSGAREVANRANREVDQRMKERGQQASDSAYRQQLAKTLQESGRTPEAMEAYRKGMQDLQMYQKTRNRSPAFNKISTPQGYQQVSYQG